MLVIREIKRLGQRLTNSRMDEARSPTSEVTGVISCWKGWGRFRKVPEK